MPLFSDSVGFSLGIAIEEYTNTKVENGRWWRDTFTWPTVHRWRENDEQQQPRDEKNQLSLTCVFFLFSSHQTALSASQWSKEKGLNPLKMGFGFTIFSHLSRTLIVILTLAVTQIFVFFFFHTRIRPNGLVQEYRSSCQWIRKFKCFAKTWCIIFHRNVLLGIGLILWAWSEAASLPLPSTSNIKWRRTANGVKRKMCNLHDLVFGCATLCTAYARSVGNLHEPG